jgi:hypothetical protein
MIASSFSAFAAAVTKIFGTPDPAPTRLSTGRSRLLAKRTVAPIASEGETDVSGLKEQAADHRLPQSAFKGA